MKNIKISNAMCTTINIFYKKETTLVIFFKHIGVGSTSDKQKMIHYTFASPLKGNRGLISASHTSVSVVVLIPDLY